MLRNKKGALFFGLVAIPLCAQIMGYVVISIATVGLGQTALNGQLKKNGQTIWCKMQNKDAAYCDKTYR